MRHEATLDVHKERWLRGSPTVTPSGAVWATRTPARHARAVERRAAFGHLTRERLWHCPPQATRSGVSREVPLNLYIARRRSVTARRITF